MIYDHQPDNSSGMRLIYYAIEIRVWTSCNKILRKK